MAMDRRRFEGGNLPLRTAMERLFEGSFISPQSFMGSGGFPPADVHMNDEDITICLAVPGARPEDINISVTGDVVTISGQVQHKHRAERAGQGQGGSRRPQPYLEEIWSGSFQRSFSLPMQVDANKASADFENGILTVTLPKSEATKPRKIQVQSRGTTTQSGGNQQQSQPQTETETVPVQSGS